MRIDNVQGLDRVLATRLKVAITHLTQRGLASGTHHNDGLRISVHSNRYVEIILRHINESSVPAVHRVETALEECGLQLESNVSAGWNKPRDQPGARYETRYEVGVKRGYTENIEVSYDMELVEGVYVMDLRK